MSINKFRFVCQKILPTIYDDSLSYYELLNKIVKKLNEVIESQNTTNENFENLYNEFIKLKRVLKTKYVTILDSNYPDFLKQVSCPPFVLFYEGNLKLAKNLKVGDAFIYSAFNDKRYLSTVEPSTDKGKFCFDYIIACESHDEFFNIREHVMDKKVPLKDYSKNTKHKQQER